MTVQELNILEKELRKTLPESYKSLLLNYPPELVDLGAPANAVHDLYLNNNHNEIVDLNRSLPKFPDAFIAIGADGCGNFYFINREDERVYFLDHEEVVFKDEETGEVDFDKTMQLKNESVRHYVAYLKQLFKD